MSRAFLCVVSSWVQHQCGCTDQRPSCGWTRPTKMRPKIFLIKRIVLPETTVMPFAAPSLSYSLWLIGRWEWGRQCRPTESHLTGTSDTPTSQGRSIGTRSTTPWLHSSIYTFLFITESSSSDVATLVLLHDLWYLFFLQISLYFSIFHWFLFFFFSWLQRSVKAWLMMVTKRLWTLIYRLWWSKLCSGSTVIVHSWNVSFVNFTTVFIIIVICLLMDRIHWIWRGLKLNFTYARCLYVCIQVKLQISRRLSEIQTLQ